MDELRRELEQSGFSNTTLDLRQGGRQDQARQQFAFMERGTAAGGPATAPESTAPNPPTTRPTGPDADGRLDIQA
jgi:hypothetical protein